MVGMLQILTYMFAFYLVVKGIEVLQVALTSNREKRNGIIALGIVTLIACSIAAVGFVAMQEEQATSVGSHTMP